MTMATTTEALLSSSFQPPQRRFFVLFLVLTIAIFMLMIQNQNLTGYVTFLSRESGTQLRYALTPNTPSVNSNAYLKELARRAQADDNAVVAADNDKDHTLPESIHRRLNLSEEKLKWNLTLPAGAFSLVEPNDKLDHDPFYLDPLRSPHLLPNRTTITKLPYKPQTEYLGVLLDAGRQYFPVWWIERLMDYLQLMNYNLIHFRLTDDQAFNVRLQSHPELAQPSAAAAAALGHNTTQKNNMVVYSTDDLKHLVEYGKQRGITLMPEINIPGHAGAWSGVPGLLVPCVEFICEKGYGVPINVTHPKALHVIRDVIQEIREIFYTSDYLHLGGDELEMILPCFREVGAEPFDYNAFEQQLKQVLRDLKVPLDKVMRWEMTGSPINGEMIRAGEMTHNWISRNLVKRKDGTIPPFFISNGLYFDTDDNADVVHNYRNTQYLLQLEKKPVAIIAGTFELGVDTWFNRNIIQRLLTVSIGASHETMVDSDQVRREYEKHCLKTLGFPKELCDIQGRPIPDHRLSAYKTIWKSHWSSWRGSICERLSVEEERKVLKQSSYNSRMRGSKSQILKESSDLFWESLGSVGDEAKGDDATDQGKQHAIDYTGIILDLVEETSDVASVKKIIDKLAKLGFNLLQLRLISDMGFALWTKGLRHLVDTRKTQYSEMEIQDIVAHAEKRGIEVMPEISISSRSGGWFNTQSLVPCVDLMCASGRGLALNVTDTSVYAHVSALVMEIRRLFSSKFFHLGYDEREESLACYEEAGIIDPLIDRFEHKLSLLLQLQDIELDHVLRWENAEGTIYEGRAGTGTHYRLTDGPKRRSTDGPIFVSTGLDFSEGDDLDAWDIYDRVRTISKTAPTGIMAVVNVVDDKSWQALNIDGRLVALSMGLSKDSKLSESQFRDTYMATCTSFEVSSCEASGKFDADTASQWKSSHTKEQEAMLKATCDARVETKTFRLPSPELIGELS